MRLFLRHNTHATCGGRPHLASLGQATVRHEQDRSGRSLSGYQSDRPGFRDILRDADIWAVLSYNRMHVTGFAKQTGESTGDFRFAFCGQIWF
jgi:hypothetical protein